MTWGSEPVTIVEIDTDFCLESYGVAPCTAAIGVTGANKCFNTYRSCQSAANWNRGTKTLRFAMPIMDLPIEWDAIPSVSAVDITPTQLNIGGSSQTSGPLGQRGKCTVTFTDHPDGDIKTDPYLADRAYDPYTRSTFWAKWLTRNVYYTNRPMRIYQGYLGQDISEMKVSNFIIDRVTGPDSSGRVKITGMDILRLADNDKALAPELSPGELDADITDIQTTLTITGALLTDYPASGKIRVGKELIDYTSRALAGAVMTFSGLTRGVDGSEAKEHSTGDRVQRCLVYVEAMPHVVAKELLVDYAHVPEAFIPYADWEAEANVWLPQFAVSTIISEPTGVNKLLASLTGECMFYIWWDETSQTIPLRAIRPFTDTATKWNYEGHILEGSMKATEDPNQRASRVWVYYQPQNWAEKLDDEDNFRKVRLSLDLQSESREEYDEKKVKSIYCRWIRTDAQALNVGARYISRYRDNQKYLTLRVDASQRDVWTADVVDITSPQYVDFVGENEERRFQVISAKEVQAGEVIQYDLQEFEFVGGKFGFWMADDAPIYDNATEVDRRSGMWWADDDGLLPDGSPGYTWQ